MLQNDPEKNMPSMHANATSRSAKLAVLLNTQGHKHSVSQGRFQMHANIDIPLNMVDFYNKAQGGISCEVVLLLSLHRCFHFGRPLHY